MRALEGNINPTYAEPVTSRRTRSDTGALGSTILRRRALLFNRIEAGRAGGKQSLAAPDRDELLAPKSAVR